MSNSLWIYERLLDIAAKGLPDRKHAYAPEFEAEFFELFEGAVPFDITEAWKWLAIGVRQHTPILSLFSELPTCLPVYERMYCEYGSQAVPNETVSGLATVSATRKREKRLTREDSNWAMGGTVFYLEDETESGEVAFREREWERSEAVFTIPEGGFMSVFEMVYTTSEQNISTLRGMRALVGFNADGDILRTEDVLALQILMEPLPNGETETDEEYRQAFTIFAEAIYVSLFACSLMHCKNVSEKINALPRQRARDRARRNLAPVVWKTLEVQPVGRSRAARHGENDGFDETPESNKRRLHLCRGHFAEYGINGKGKLFGKYSGRFWIPPVVKGASSSGLVLKDYAIRTGKL